ncbi:MAG: monovalent cation/H+ antiporter complex subunit F [Acidobacteriota bacterium]|nr:monovalent cation/H+ antiporter complex subunit F [Acidobacteriota bacterium]
MALVIVAAAFIALALAVARLWRGPTQADRVVALDVAFAAVIALAAAAALASGQPLFLDVGIGLAMVGFVGTIAWARIIDRLARREDA